jgi:hypothetical protein
MKPNHQSADQLLRKALHSQGFNSSPIVKARPFDPVAYAAALEILG